MSRIGKKPIPLPDKTKVSYQDRVITVQGQKGTLSRPIPEPVDIEVDSGAVRVTRPSDEKSARSMQGLVRSLVNNMVSGVSQGFERTLEITGIGYRAEVKDKGLLLTLGFSHPVHFPLPTGVTAAVDKNTVIRLQSIDKELLGHTAAAIRRLKPPEPYKGKGIKYAEERIRRKAGKTGTK